MSRSVIILLISFSLSISAVGQKLNEYKFVYKFRFGESRDSSKFSIDTLQSEIEALRVEILDSKSKPISFLTIGLKTKDTTIWAITDTNGLFNINVKPSNYNLTISGVGYKTLNLPLFISQHKSLSCKVTLAESAPLEGYAIHSTEALTQEDIAKIIKCVQENKENYHECQKPNRYYVTIEI